MRNHIAVWWIPVDFLALLDEGNFVAEKDTDVLRVRV